MNLGDCNPPLRPGSKLRDRDRVGVRKVAFVRVGDGRIPIAFDPVPPLTPPEEGHLACLPGVRLDETVQIRVVPNGYGEDEPPVWGQ